MLQYSLFLGNRLVFSKSPWSSREMSLLICFHEEKCFLFCLFVCMYAQKHLPHSLRRVYDEVHDYKL